MSPINGHYITRGVKFLNCDIQVNNNFINIFGEAIVQFFTYFKTTENNTHNKMEYLRLQKKYVPFIKYLFTKICCYRVVV